MKYYVTLLLEWIPIERAYWYSVFISSVIEAKLQCTPLLIRFWLLHCRGLCCVGDPGCYTLISFTYYSYYTVREKRGGDSVQIEAEIWQTISTNLLPVHIC